MKSPLEQITELDMVINNLQKVDSLLLSGQVINGWRELRKLSAFLQNKRNNFIQEEKQFINKGG
jgi:hypothetical protein